MEPAAISIIAVVIIIIIAVVVVAVIMTRPSTNVSTPAIVSDSTPIAASTTVSTPAPSYTMSANMDMGGNDIACYKDGSSSDFCKIKCNGDPTCVGYNYIHPNTVWGTASGCCYKNKKIPLTAQNGVDYYTLNK